ncbi:LuxR family transcriptional regulator [Rhodococcus spelaei]|uniref:LuxR family transcriptional regulator n=1 Tax=Rhodococcus spelaei TaxID=2546320 RepID=A0A541B0W0_9NOCA|nr:LuxR C-terminal-related transcriptional regulator [Rhodococcus spelaei]TQF65956.1 LuxR family transcriptional regulator [Rhodococcus spelaei]
MSSVAHERIVGNLPHELTSFVGRRHEIEGVRGLLSDFRIVTVTGIGGVGKTRLALRVGEGSRRTYPDGVWLVELGDLREPNLLAQTVATALGLRERLAYTPLDLLIDFLTDRRLLLVLDNCEHLVDAVAEFVTALLRACPELRILATSRESLGVSGEATLRVPPMTVPDSDRPTSTNGLSRYEAVNLFTERARAVLPEFSLTEDNQLTVAEICQRLEGLPLLIELAAARLRVLSPQQILHRLTNRFQLLTVVHRGVPPRHQTLRWCVDWSYELCTSQEQRLWRRLAVFAGGVEFDAIEGICAGELQSGEVSEVVASLVDKSILTVEEGSVDRYRMLATLREYGLEKLAEAGEEPMLRRRHRDWYERLAVQAGAEWIGPRQLEWIARLDHVHADLREALEFSTTEPGETDAALRIITGSYPFWVLRGLYSEGRYWIERATAGDAGPPTSIRTTVLCSGAMLAMMQGDLGAGAALTDTARQLAESLGDESTTAFVVSATGYLATFSGEFPRATECFESCLEALRSAGDLLPRVGTLAGLAMASGLSGDHLRAIACHEEVIALTEPHGEAMYRSYSLSMLALAVWEQGDPGRATHLVEESLRLTRLVDDPLGSAMCLEILGWVAAEADDAERAAVLMGASASVGEAAGSPSIVVRDLFGHHERLVQRSTQALGRRSFDAAFERGRDLAVDEAVAYALRDTSPTKPRAHRTGVDLTRRERQIAELVAQGLTNKAIAEQLVISQRTAEGHVEKVRAKLSFTTRAQIAAWVVAQNAV